jgi:hypothetical protein
MMHFPLPNIAKIIFSGGKYFFKEINDKNVTLCTSNFLFQDKFVPMDKWLVDGAQEAKEFPALRLLHTSKKLADTLAVVANVNGFDLFWFYIF